MLRTDSPTCDIEGLNISFHGFRANVSRSSRVTSQTHISQGCPLERLIFMRQPPGGVPDVDISAEHHVRRACSNIWYM